MSPLSLLTIGHSNHSAERFIELLKQHGVDALADVRSSPFSRFNPQFNRELLQKSLAAASIRYVFLGVELGARSSDPRCYVGDKVSYVRLAETTLFRRGIERLEQGAAKHRIAIMCAEKDPLTCHRTILVARHLAARGFAIQHILEDGTLEAHEAATARLLAEYRLPERDLFRTRDQIVADAYQRRGEEIAYSTEAPPDHAEASEAVS